ncbi:hypothetical protein PBMFNG_PBMFNG_12485, partial [Dysosmobacter welbionis]
SAGAAAIGPDPFRLRIQPFLIHRFHDPYLHYRVVIVLDPSSRSDCQEVKRISSEKSRDKAPLGGYKA